MGRKRIPGLRKRGQVWHIEKQICGKSICESTGTSDLKEAELILANRMDEIRKTKIFGLRQKRTFREAATYFLETNMDLDSIGEHARYIRQLDPFIGHLPIDRVHLGVLEPFIKARKAEGMKNKTINLALATVRRILNLASRLWRDESGLTWLETAPLIQMLPITDARRPYPLSWDEQARLFQALPDHLARMCLFKVNTGTREQEVCMLRWEWEVKIPELETSVFLIPGQFVKNREDRLVVLNKTALSVVEQMRGVHPEFVFSYKGKPVKSMGNSSWLRIRTLLGLEQVRIHDLKHTFGRRLRAAGVSNETRKVLLGHCNGDITSHYSAPELDELISAANKVCSAKSGKTPALTLIKLKRQGVG